MSLRAAYKTKTRTPLSDEEREFDNENEENGIFDETNNGEVEDQLSKSEADLIVSEPSSIKTVVNDRLKTTIGTVTENNEIHVVRKFILFSILTPLLPFLTYIFTSKHIFLDSKVPCAIAAVFVANTCLFAYIVIAFIEEKKKD